VRRAWWRKGVAFQCQPNCGQCCDEPNGRVYLAPKDAERLARHAGCSVEEWLERDAHQLPDGRYVLNSRKSDGRCIHFNERRQCDIYTVRPQQCAAFPWWGENLATSRSWEDTREACPGIDAENALVIDGHTIRLHVMADRTSTKSFDAWPPSPNLWKR